MVAVGLMGLGGVQALLAVVCCKALGRRKRKKKVCIMMYSGWLSRMHCCYGWVGGWVDE